MTSLGRLEVGLPEAEVDGVRRGRLEHLADARYLDLPDAVGDHGRADPPPLLRHCVGGARRGRPMAFAGTRAIYPGPPRRRGNRVRPSPPSSAHSSGTRRRGRSPTTSPPTPATWCAAVAGRTPATPSTCPTARWCSTSSPSGSSGRATVGVSGPGMVLNPMTLEDEIRDVERSTCSGASSSISERAHAILPLHAPRTPGRRSSAASRRPGERRRHDRAAGSDPRTADRYGRWGIRFADLVRPKLLAERLALSTRPRRMSPDLPPEAELLRPAERGGRSPRPVRARDRAGPLGGAGATGSPSSSKGRRARSWTSTSARTRT